MTRIPWLLALVLAGARASAGGLPALPASVALRGGAGPCGSPAMLDNLRYRFLLTADPSDLTVHCHPGQDELALDVYAGSKGIARFTVERSPTSTPERLAFVGVSTLAKDPDVIAAALESYMGSNSRLAAGAADALSSGDDARAAELFTAALESDLEPQVLYFGLYKAAASRHRLRDAKWYLAAYTRSSGLRARDLSDAVVRPLQDARNAGWDAPTSADGAFADYESMRDGGHWNATLFYLRKIVLEAPWYEPAYHSLARTFEATGWRKLERHWKRRAAFVRDINKDTELGEEIEKRLVDAP